MLVGSGVLVGGRSPGHGHHRAAAGPDLGDDAGIRRGPDDVVAAVIPAGDAVQAPDVDGVGSADGRLQFSAAGNAAGHGFHLRVISGVAGIVVKVSPNPFCPFPLTAARPWNGIDWYAMDSNALDTNPFHCECIPMQRYGYQWNGYLCIGCRGRRRGPERGQAERPDDHGGLGGRKPVTGAISARWRQANDDRKSRLRTSIRCAIITVIAHLYLAEIAPEIPPPETRP